MNQLLKLLANVSMASAIACNSVSDTETVIPSLTHHWSFKLVDDTTTWKAGVGGCDVKDAALAQICASYYTTDDPDLTGVAGWVKATSKCYVCKATPTDATPAPTDTIQKLSLCTSCAPVQAKTAVDIYPTYQGNSTTKRVTLYRPLDDSFENICFFKAGGASVKDCTVTKVDSDVTSITKDNAITYTATNYTYATAAPGVSSGYGINVTTTCTAVSDSSSVVGDPLELRSTCFDAAPKRKDASITTSTILYKDTTDKVVIYSNPITSLFDVTQSCPSSYVNATLSDKTCSISDTYPFPISCDQNNVNGYNTTITVTFNQHQESAYKIDFKVSAGIKAPDAPSSNTWIWIVLVLIVVGAAGGGGFYYYKKRQGHVEMSNDEMKQGIM